MVLNVDGSSLSNLRKTLVGGLMHNQDGIFQLNLYGSVGLFNIPRPPCKNIHAFGW